MIVFWLVAGTFLGLLFPELTVESDTNALIRNLSASRLSERSRAADALINLGEVAKPAIARLGESSDLEQRRIAASILDRIEGQTLSRPKTISLDFQNQPLREIVDLIAERSQEALAIQAVTDLKLSEKRITLVSKDQVTFWDAVERLEKIAGLQIDLLGNNNPGPNRNGMILGNLNPNRRWRPLYSVHEIMLKPRESNFNSPRFRTGRFEVFISNISLHRDKILGTSNGSPPNESSRSKFEVRLRVLPEPSLTISKFGDVSHLEAIDDQGQSLVPETPIREGDIAVSALTNSYMMAPAANLLPLAIRLQYPERPGHFIRTLRGQMEIMVVSTKSDPVIGSLVSSLNKSVVHNNSTLIIHEIKQGGMATIKLVEMTLSRFDGSLPSNNNTPFRRTANLAPAGVQGWLIFVDAKGRCIDRVTVTPYNLPDGQRRMLQFHQPVGADPAVEVRYLSPTWATLQVPFEFRDIPMP